MDTPPEKGLPAEDNPLGLDDAELQVLHKQTELPATDAGYLAIYKYATSLDLAIMAGSAVMSAASGACMPLMTV